MSSSSLLSVLALAWLLPWSVSSFAFVKKTPRHTQLWAAVDDDLAEPSFFQMQQIPTATSGEGLDRIVDCAENGQCDVEEMTKMIEELEQLNLECEGEHSRECSLDAVAARNVLKVALASKVAVEDAMKECITPEDVAEDEPNPFSEMHAMNDECLSTDFHPIPTASSSSSLDRIVQCAERGDCPVGEMDDMVEELERLNLECENALSRECSLQAVEARNILKVALASQAAMAREVLARKD